MSDYGILLTDDGTKSYIARCIPGAYWVKGKGWYLKHPNSRSATVALMVFPELAFEHPELAEKRDEAKDDVRPFDNATPADLRVTASPFNVLDPYEFQNVDIGYIDAVLKQHGGAYIGWERGLGKTFAAASLIDSTEAQRTLVVAPNTAKRSVWEPELARFLPGYIVHVLPNEKKKREATLNWWAGDIEGGEGNRRVLIVHPEQLTIIESNPLGRLLKAGGGWKKLGVWDLIVVDEAHRFKNPGANMTKALKKIKASKRLAMSGTIIANHVEELFSVLQFLFPKVYKSKWRDWNDRYLEYIDGPYGSICLGVKPGCVPDMRTELGVFMVYRRKEDELDLPDKTEQTLLIDLNSSQRKVYDELRDTCMATLADGSTVKAEEGLVMLTKLRQVASGLDLLGEVADSSKLDLAVELALDSPDEAFVIFSWYKAAAHAMADRLARAGVDAYLIDGDVSHTDRARRIGAFQQGDRRCFIGTISTLGESVNLQRASNAIFLDRSWNPGDNAQAADRIYRIGQDKPVTITHLVARNTVDELRVLPALANKEALRAAVLGGR